MLAKPKREVRYTVENKARQPNAPPVRVHKGCVGTCASTCHNPPRTLVTTNNSIVPTEKDTKVATIGSPPSPFARLELTAACTAKLVPAASANKTNPIVITPPI